MGPCQRMYSKRKVPNLEQPAVQWNAATELVHQLGYACPLFRRSKRWLENERRLKILC